MALIIGGTDDTDPWNNEKANLVSLIRFQAQKSTRNAIFIKKKKTSPAMHVEGPEKNSQGKQQKH